MSSNTSSWYSISGYPSRKYRAYVNAYVESQTDTTATIYVEGCVQAYYLSQYGARVRVYVNGSEVASTAVAIMNSGGEAGNWGWASGRLTVSKKASSQPIACACVVSGETVGIYGGLNGGNPSTSAYVSVSAITYYAPNAPSGLSAIRENDNRNVLSWSAPSTSATKPVSAILIERSVDGGQWSQIASVSGTSTSYNDTTTSADHYYTYRVRSQNTAGYSGYATSGYTYNTPAAPTKVTASRLEETTVLLAVANEARTATALEVQRSTDGSSWSTVATLSGSPVTEVTDGPGGGTFYYRARNTRGDLASDWSPTSNAVVTITPPSAPTLVSPASGMVVSKSQSVVTFEWLHNPIDGSAQTAAELRYSLDGGNTWQVVEIDGNAASYGLSNAFAVNSTVTWGVRTKGAHQDFGPWSGNRSFNVYQEPMVAFAQPTDGFVVENTPIVLKLQYEDPSGELVSAAMSISDGSKVVWSRTVSGTDYVITADEWVPDNGKVYILTATVRSSSSLTASATREISVSFVLPQPADVHIENDLETGYVTLVTYIAEQNAGKNLLPSDYSFAAAESNGLSLVVAEDLSMQILGVNESDDWVTFTASSPSEENRLVLSEGTYTASPYITLATPDGNKSGTFTVESPVEVYSAYIAVAPRSSVSEVVYPQVEVGEQATVYEPYQEPLVAPASISVWRESKDGRVLLADGLQAGAGVVDKYAPLNIGYQYIVKSFADSGAANSTTFDNLLATKWAFLYFAGGGIARGMWNPDDSWNMEQDVDLVRYIGREYPVAYMRDSIEETHNVAVTLMDREEVRAFRKMMATHEPVVAKLWDSLVFHAVPQLQGKPKATVGAYWGDVGVTLTRIDGEAL